MKCLKNETVVVWNVHFKTRVTSHPGFGITVLAIATTGTRAAVPVSMKELMLTVEQRALVASMPLAASIQLALVTDEEALMSMQLTEAKRLCAAAFERLYLIRVMARAGGSVSEGARLSGLDRTNFRRLLRQHNLR